MPGVSCCCTPLIPKGPTKAVPRIVIGFSRFAFSRNNFLQHLSSLPMNDANARSVGALTLTQDEVSRRVRRAVRGFAPPPKAATRQLWRRNVKLWHQRHTHDQFVAPPPRQVEQQLVEWFDVLKLKHTGKVEATEMSALLEAVGVQAVVPAEELSLHDFCRCPVQFKVLGLHLSS